VKKLVNIRLEKAKSFTKIAGSKDGVQLATMSQSLIEEIENGQ